MFVQQVSLTSSTMFLPHTCLFAIYELNYPEAITALGCNKNKEFPLYYILRPVHFIKPIMIYKTHEVMNKLWVSYKKHSSGYQDNIIFFFKELAL